MQPNQQLKKSFYKLFLTNLFLLFTSFIGFSQSNTCTGATSLTIGTSCSTTAFDMSTGFTNTGPALTVCTGTPNYDGWYTFTTDATTTTISIDGTSNRRLGFALYTGSCGSLTQVNCTIPNTANANFTNISVTASTTYFLRIIRTNTGTNSFSGTVCVYKSAPTGCTNSSSFGTVSAPTNNIPVQIASCNYQTEYSTINSVVAGSTYQFTNSAGGFITIHSGTFNGPIVASGNSPLSFTAPSSGTFYAHWNTNSSCGTATNCTTTTISCTSCSAPVTPPNDNCSGAVSLTVNSDLNCGTTTHGTIELATDSGVTGSGCGGTDDDDVWYSFVATSTAHQISLLNVSGSTTDLYHSVYSGTCGSLGAAIICSDPNTSTIGGLTIGNTYYVQVYSWTSTTGQNTNFDICVGTPPPPPANDDCSGAISLSVNSSCSYSTYTTTSATGSTGVPAPGCGSYSGGDVWFSVVVPSNGQIVVDTQTGVITDSGMALYSGTCGSLTLLECDDDDSANGSMSMINYSGLTPGSTVYIRVWEYSNDNPGSFGICVTSPPCGSPVPSNITILPTSDTTATLSWTAPTPAPASGYDYYISTSSTTPTSGTTPTGSTAAGVTSVNLTGLTGGTTYYVWVRSDCGGGSGSSGWSAVNIFSTPVCSTFGPGTGTTTLGCPSVISGGLGLNGADPAPINCTAMSTCVDLEATYLDLGDTSNYTVNSIPFNPPYQFNCLRNPVSVNTDDVWSPAVNLPFDFCFFGNSYNQCTIGSNGILSFDMTNAGTSSGYSFSNNLPSTTGALFANSIYGVYHDINPGVSGEVGWELITLNTGCRALVASWYNVPLFGDNTQFYTGMMVLYENTNVIEVYIQNKPNDPDAWNDNNAIVGIQNSDATQAVVAPNRNGLSADWTTTNEAWRFTPSGTSITSLTWYEGSGTSGPIVGTTDTINVCPTATTTYTASITYTLCDGSTLTETEETTVTINGSKVWNGSVSTDWDNDNNWTPVGKPTAMDCVVIPNTANDPIISGSGYNGLGLNMSIQNDAVLTVNSDNAVSITDWVNISTTGELVLDNAASLIQTNNIANTGAGNMLMDRDVNIRKLDYVYWSSPVTSFPSSLISPGTSTNLIWKWTPTVSGNGAGNAGTWVNGNENMTLGKGYIVRGPGSYTSTIQNYTATFVGTPNNGNISIPITRGSYTSAATYQICATCTPATNLDDNWNLVGNPYPSAIDAIDFLTANTAIDGYIKLWTHGTLPSSAIVDPFYEGYVYNYSIGDYITYNSLGVSAGPGLFNGYIGAGQGFFVSMLDGGPSTKNLNFTNALRSNTYDNSEFFRNTSINNNKHRIWLDIISSNNTSTRTLVGYIDGATYTKDRLFDAKTDNKIELNLYSLISDEKLTIQGRPTPFDDNDIVPLGFKVPEAGIYSIGIATVDGLFETSSQAIFLQDLELNIIHDLKSMPYSFQVSEGEHNSRFNLIYKNNLNENSNELINENVWISTSENLMIQSNNQNISEVKVFDILGRVLTTKTKLSSKSVILNEIIKSNSGLILEITLDNNKVIYKKTIY